MDARETKMGESMTDAEAKDIISNHLHVCGTQTCRKCAAIMHVLTALADREDLVMALDAEFETVADVYKRTYAATTAARRHMKGE
jgi:hypothetical protein